MSYRLARWYVTDRERHPTFKPVAYQELVITERSPGDNYYKAMIRTGDIDVLVVIWK